MKSTLWTLFLLYTCSSALVGEQLTEWTAASAMRSPRYYHSEVLLDDGRMLVAGGQSGCVLLSAGCVVLTSAELYDPATNEWTDAGQMISARANHFAVRLPSGKVLVGGGVPPIKDTELYDPILGIWSSTGTMNYARSNAQATLLRDGRVLVTGGADPCCSPLSGMRVSELYDSNTGKWTVTAPMITTRNLHTSTLLQDGRVLVAGGGDWGDLVGNLRWSAEIYDPATGQWTSTGHLRTARALHRANLLADGRVLVTGGSNLSGSSFAGNDEIYDPATNEWSDAAQPSIPRLSHTATLLPDGRVLVAGGFGSGPGNPALSASEIYDSTANAWTPAGNLSLARGHHAAALTVKGSVLLTGGAVTTAQGLTQVEMFINLFSGLAIVSAASPAPAAAVAAESIASAYGDGFTNGAEATPEDHIRLRVQDSAGVSRQAPLLAVTKQQINFQIPPGTSPGLAMVVVTLDEQTLASGMVRVQSVAPGLFSANGDGRGVASASLLRVRSDGSRAFEAVVAYDIEQKRFVAVPIDFGPEGDQLFLTLYGTGIRKAVKVTVNEGGIPIDPLFAGASPEWIGLDQVNVALPRSLSGRGTVDIVLTADDQISNTVQLTFR